MSCLFVNIYEQSKNIYFNKIQSLHEQAHTQTKGGDLCVSDN